MSSERSDPYLSFWCYNPSNDDETEDYWNDESFSWFSGKRALASFGCTTNTVSSDRFLPEASDVEAEPQQKSSRKRARKIDDPDEEEFNSDALDDDGA